MQTVYAPVQNAIVAAVVAAMSSASAPEAAYAAPHFSPDRVMNSFASGRDDYLSTISAPSVNIQYFGFGSTSSR